MRDRFTVWLGVVGVLAVVAGAVLAGVALWPHDDPRAAAKTVVPTTRLVDKAGGFTVRVPTAMAATRHGRTVRLATGDRQVVVTVGPVGGGTLGTASHTLMTHVRSSYPRVRVLGTRRDRVDQRKALTTYGTARTAGEKGATSLRFVVLVVAARPRNYAVTAFTARDSDPKRVVPLVNAVAGSLHVLPGRH